MLEKELEKKFKAEVEKLGGRALKLTSPGYAGIMDRMVLFSPGIIVFVEIKRPGEVLRPLQEHRIAGMRGLGFKTWVVDSLESLASLISWIIKKQEMNNHIRFWHGKESV